LEDLWEAQATPLFFIFYFVFLLLLFNFFFQKKTNYFIPLSFIFDNNYSISQ